MGQVWRRIAQLRVFGHQLPSKSFGCRQKARIVGGNRIASRDAKRERGRKRDDAADTGFRLCNQPAGLVRGESPGPFVGCQDVGELDERERLALPLRVPAIELLRLRREVAFDQKMGEHIRVHDDHSRPVQSRSAAIAASMSSIVSRAAPWRRTSFGGRFKRLRRGA